MDHTSASSPGRYNRILTPPSAHFASHHNRQDEVASPFHQSSAMGMDDLSKDFAYRGSLSPAKSRAAESHFVPITTSARPQGKENLKDGFASGMGSSTNAQRALQSTGSTTPRQGHGTATPTYNESPSVTVSRKALPTSSRIPVAAEKAFGGSHGGTDDRLGLTLGSRGAQGGWSAMTWNAEHTFNKSGLNRHEQLKLESPEIKRKAIMAQLYFLDYYFDLITYLDQRKSRLALIKDSLQQQRLSSSAVHQDFSDFCERERGILRRRRTKLRLESFHIISQIGQGGYGEVYLARKKDTNEVCALKRMAKKTLQKMDEVKHILVERDVLTHTDSPWLVKLLYAWQDPQMVYLAMEYVPGGDFRTLLQNAQMLNTAAARVYAAEMFMGINELHKLGYIHRDLKPENFLVDATGHAKLTDFGLATGAVNPSRIVHLKDRLDAVKNDEVVYRSSEQTMTLYRTNRADPVNSHQYGQTVVGSADYMAPEVLRGRGYGPLADYWSLGCMIFEFLAGYPPFAGASSDETWNNLQHWEKVLRRPKFEKKEHNDNMTDEAWDLIVRLVCHQDKRLPSVKAVAAHPFFKVLNFDYLREVAPLRDDARLYTHPNPRINEQLRSTQRSGDREGLSRILHDLVAVQPPFVPELDGEVDNSYFDDFNDEAELAKYKEVFDKQNTVANIKEKSVKIGRGVFVGFTFKGKRENLKYDLMDA